MTRFEQRRRSAWIGLLVVLLLAASAAAAWHHPSVEWFRMSRRTLAQLETDLSLEPNDWRLHYWYGRRAAEVGDFERAEVPLRRAFGANEAYLPAAVELGRVLLGMGKIDEAYQMLRLVTGRDPSNLDGHLALGQLYRSQGAFHRAVEELEVVLQSNPRHVSALYEIAACRSGMQQPKEAEKALRQALVSDPKNVLVLSALSRLRREAGALEEAEKLAQEAVDLAPGEALPLLELGRVHAAKSSSPENRKIAIATLERAAALDPRHPEIRFELAKVHFDDENWSECLQQLERCLESDPSRTQAFYLVSRCLASQGRHEEADRVRRRFERMQNYDRQVNDLSSRLGAKPDDVALRRKLAELHYREGHLERAIDAYRIALQWEPDDEKSRSRLVELIQLRNDGAARPESTTH